MANMTNTGVPLKYVKVVVGYEGPEGTTQDVTHDIKDVRIVTCTHQIEEKTQKVKDEEGNLVGHEPTGEYVLTLKVKYLKE